MNTKITDSADPEARFADSVYRLMMPVGIYMYETLYNL